MSKCPLCGREYKKVDLKYPLMRFYGITDRVCELCKDDAVRISRRYLQINNNKCEEYNSRYL